MQLSSLSRLERLHFVDISSNSNGYSALSWLHQLTDLRMSKCDALPDSLGQITWLRSLEVSRL